MKISNPATRTPTKGHADGYYFDVNKGRILSEYQMLYQPEGEGIFNSKHIKDAEIKAGDLFLLFPGEWHTYRPLPDTGWKSYWIGFKGKNMDDRVKAGFMSAEHPIYHVGYSGDIIKLYDEAYDSRGRGCILATDTGGHREPSDGTDVFVGTQHHPGTKTGNMWK